MREYRTISDTRRSIPFFPFFFIFPPPSPPLRDTLFSIENLIPGAADACSETKQILIMTLSPGT